MIGAHVKDLNLKNYITVEVNTRSYPKAKENWECHKEGCRTLCDHEIFNSNPVIKKMCPEVHELLKLYMTVPVARATAKRTLSMMRRIEAYLPSSMSQQG